jgi:hypothetical protein
MLGGDVHVALEVRLVPPIVAVNPRVIDEALFPTGHLGRQDSVASVVVQSLDTHIKITVETGDMDRWRLHGFARHERTHGRVHADRPDINTEPSFGESPVTPVGVETEILAARQ